MASAAPSCDVCENDQISQAAKQWCTNCQKGLCINCEKMHRVTKMSSEHITIGIEDYLKRPNISFIQTCADHGKVFESFCKTHDMALCKTCASSQHKCCRDIIPLEEAAKYAKTSTALTALEETISVGLKNVKKIIENTSLEYYDEQEKRIMDEIRDVRTAINNHLDEIQNGLILELESKLVMYRSKHLAVFKHIKDVEKTMKRFNEQTSAMKQLVSDLQIFLGTRQINKDVHECLKSASKYYGTDKYRVSIEIEPVLKSLLTEVKTFGNINTEVTQIPLSQPGITRAQMHVYHAIKRVDEIAVRLKKKFNIRRDYDDDQGGIFVTGCAIFPNGQMLIADHAGTCNNQLMQYNRDGRFARYIPVSSKPYDVAVIDSDRVAVSYDGSNYVEMLNIHNTIAETKIDLGNNTWGLSYQRGKLFVVVDNRGLVVIELSGRILNTFNLSLGVRAVAAATDRIYYSDYYKDTVTCCDMNGKQIWQFQSHSVNRPVGITVDNNQNVLVAGVDSKNITIISRDGKTSKTLLTRSDGLWTPRVISINKDTGDLLVCNESEIRQAFLFQII